MKWRMLILILILVTGGCERTPEPRRKIRLADQGTASMKGERFTSTIHLEPGARRAIAVLFFENRTGDPSLEWLQKGLTEMLIRSLSQSSSLSILSTERIFEILQQAGQSTTAQTLEVNLAALVSREANVEAVLSGSISRHGDSLRVSVQVHEPSQGRIVREESVEGKNMDALFAMVDQISRKVKATLDLSLEQQGSSQSIADLSTNSLEAWRAYAAGLDFDQKAMIQEAVRQYEKAVAADPAFVAACYKLALYLYSQGERQRGYRYFEKLKSLRSKATRKEQYQIDRLDAGIQGNVRRLVEISREWAEQNPDDIDANFNLGDLYFSLQRYDEALKYYQAILRIDPMYKIAYNQIGYCYARIGDLDNAAAVMRQYQELAPSEPNPFDSMGEIYYNNGQYRLAEKYLRHSLRNDAGFSASLLTLSHVYLDQGKNEKALEVIDQFLAQAKDPRSQANGYSQKGVIMWRMGRMDEAIACMQRTTQSPDLVLRGTMWVNELFLEKGDEPGARASLLDHYAFIRDTLMASDSKYTYYLAQLALWNDLQPGPTIEYLEKALTRELNAQVQTRLRFYLTLLEMKNGRPGGSRPPMPDPAAGFLKLLQDIHELPLARDSWKNFLLFNRFARLPGRETAAIYDQLIRYCHDQELTGLEMLFHLFLADWYACQNEADRAAAEFAGAGVPDEGQWLVIAPYDNTNGFLKKFPPERRVNLAASSQDREGEPAWQHPDDGYSDGYIDLKRLYKKYNWSVGYGLIGIQSPDRRKVQIRLGTNDSARLWLNGKEVWRMNLGRDAIFDNDLIDVELQPGRNLVLLKVCNCINEWGFYFRVTDSSGRGMPDLHFVAADQNPAAE